MTNSMVNGHEASGQLDENLLRTISGPSASDAIPPADLARSMGIGGLPTKEEAIKALEAEVLAPVRDLSGPELWRWQT
jgi:antiviral helicase SKI2